MNAFKPLQDDSDETRLRGLLAEDGHTPEAVETLLPVVRNLRAWPVPGVTATQAEALVTRLEAAWPGAVASHPSLRARLKAVWIILRGQCYIVQREILWASSLVMLLGVVVTVLLSAPGPFVPGDVMDLPMVLIAPLIAAVGLALIYSDDTLLMREIEATTATPTIVVLLARLILVFGFDLFVSMICSVTLAAVIPTVNLSALIDAWLAPMMFVSAAAFLVAVLSANALMGVLLGVGLWLGMTFIRWWNRMTDPPVLLPDLLAPDRRLLMFSAGLAIFALGLWLSAYSGPGGRWAGGGKRRNFYGTSA